MREIKTSMNEWMASSSRSVVLARANKRIQGWLLLTRHG
jgi:hypothetical protein